MAGFADCLADSKTRQSKESKMSLRSVSVVSIQSELQVNSTKLLEPESRWVQVEMGEILPEPKVTVRVAIPSLLPIK